MVVVVFSLFCAAFFALVGERGVVVAVGVVAAEGVDVVAVVGDGCRVKVTLGMLWAVEAAVGCVG